MSTKCIVIGKPEGTEKALPIEFFACINYADRSFSGKVYVDVDEDLEDRQPFDWENIELIALAESPEELDTMFAYDDNRKEGMIYFGRWNSGFTDENYEDLAIEP